MGHGRSASSSRLPPPVQRPPPPAAVARPATVVGVGPEPVAPPRRKRKPNKGAEGITITTSSVPVSPSTSLATSPALSDAGDSEPSSPLPPVNSEEIDKGMNAQREGTGGDDGQANEMSAVETVGGEPSDHQVDGKDVAEKKDSGVDAPTHTRSSSGGGGAGAPPPRRPPPPVVARPAAAPPPEQAAPVKRSVSARPLDL